MADKLRPNQKKLWRRIYLEMFDGGSTVDDAAIAADFAVRQWEERGAFDDEMECVNGAIALDDLNRHIERMKIASESLRASIKQSDKESNNA